MTILKGYRPMKGVSKKTGRQYDGYMFYCEDTTTPPGGYGSICFEKFVDRAALGVEPFVDAQVHFNYDYRGYLQSVDLM